MKKKLPISIVCASHNGKQNLPKLIDSIVKNTHWPNEIIICGTDKEDFDLILKKKYQKLNIKKIVSKVKNQIVQRKLAIKKTKNQIIIQVDDDLVLDKKYVYLMYLHFKKNLNLKKIVSAAILFKNKKHQAMRWNAAFNKSLLFRLVLSFLNYGKKLNFMSILESGRIVPRLPDRFLKKNVKITVEDVQWVCSTVAYNKNCLKDSIAVTINNDKKAFYEDVFFSHSLQRKGYKLIIDRSIIAYHPKTVETNLFIFLKTIPSHWQIVSLFNKSFFLFFIDIIIFIIIHGLIDLSKIFYKKK